MKSLKLSFFIENINSPNTLSKIREYFNKTYLIDDVIIFSKDPLLSKVSKEFGILSVYHLSFYKDIIVFFSLEDYMVYEDSSLSKHKYLFINDNTIDDIDIESINRTTLKNINMITLKNDEIIPLVLPKIL